jgi:hypothetical protein
LGLSAGVSADWVSTQIAKNERDQPARLVSLVFIDETSMNSN